MLSRGMNERVKKLTREIRKLSPKEQAKLVHELLGTSSPEPDAKIEKAWVDEAERRWRSYRRRRTGTIPADAVFAKLGRRRGVAR
jgi:putative addiction module component (TIGR02574 family)